MADIFISYKREDQNQARRLADALEGQGWSVWWDPKLRAGERFDDIIDTALKASNCVIVIWSRRSVESNYVKDEATYALNRNKLVPLAIEDVNLPFRFEGIQTPQLFDWDGSESTPIFQSLVSGIAGILGPSPAAVEEEQRQAEEQAKQGEQALQQKVAMVEAVRQRRAKLDEQSKAIAERHKEEKAAKRKAALEAKRKVEEENYAAAAMSPSTKGEDTAHLPELEVEARSGDFVLPVFEIALGWAIGGAIGFAVGFAVGWAIGGAIGGGVTGYVLKRTEPSLSFQQLGVITLGWAIGLVIGFVAAVNAIFELYLISGTINDPISWAVGWAVGWAIGGAIGGGVTGYVLKRTEPSLSFQQLGLITLGWAIGWGIGLSIAEYIIIFITDSMAISRSISVNLSGGAIGGAIGGTIGGGVMFWRLRQIHTSK